MMIDDSELHAMQSQIIYEKIYRISLSQHSSCQDPDHPGCEECEVEQEIDD